MVSICRLDPFSRTARSRVLLLALTATTSLCTLDRAAADCVLTSGGGTGTAETPLTGARITCQAAGGAENTSVTADAGSTDVQVVVEAGASFISLGPYVTIRSQSTISNSADHATSGAGRHVFRVDGSNSTVTNNGVITTSGNQAASIFVENGSGNRIINNGSLSASGDLGSGIRLQRATNAVIINNGSLSGITVNPLNSAAGVDIGSIAGETSTTINRGLIQSNNGFAFAGGNGSERLENYDRLLNTGGGAAAVLLGGDDTFVIGGNSTVNTYVDGGGGTDVVAFGVDAGSLNVAQIGAAGTYRNFDRLEKIGNASWTLTGTNNTTALPLAVRSGVLNVDAVMPSTPVTVADGATLGGTGTVDTLSLAAGATLAPGGRTSFGTFTTSGTATFAAGSTLRVRVNERGESDRVQVNGAATINGGTVSVDVSAGYAFNTRYRILTAASIAGSRFRSAVASLALLQPVLSYDATNVYVTLERATQDPPDEPNNPDNPDEPDNPDNPPVITLDEVGHTWNQISTGRALESQGTAGPLLRVVLAQRTIPDVLRALDLLSGEAYATGAGLAAGDTETIHRTLLSRLRAAGPAGLRPAPGAEPLAYAPATVTKGPIPSAPRPAALLVDLWGQGFGTWGQRDGREGLGVASIDRTTGGFILGAETSFDTAWRIGMAGAYTQTSFELAERLSSGGIDGYHATLYGSGNLGGFALRGGATYTRHEINVDRSAVLTGFSDRAHGSLSLDSAGLFAEIGYPVRFGRVTVEPVANLSYVHTGSGSFTEDGGAMALRGRTNGFDTTWTTLGMRFSGDLTGDGGLKAHAMLGWRHAFGDRLPSTVNQFSAGGDPFLIIGSPIDRDSLVIETGLDWSVTPATTLGVRYDGQYGAHDRSQSLRGQFTARF